MNVQVTIGDHPNRTLHKFLKWEFQILRAKGVRVMCRERPSGHFHCRMINSRLFGRRDDQGFRLAIARSVTAVLFREWEYFVGRILLQEADWLDDRDWLLVRDRLNADQSLLRGYRDEVVERLSSYLIENTRLDVEGFVSFRLQDYADQVGEVISRILDDYLLDQENREFIDVLKQYVERQKKPLDVVHVVILSGSRFKIFDDEMQVLTKSLDGILATVEDDVRQEDLLISALITLAPRQVMIHGHCMSATYNTLAEVFPGALRRCSGCKYCPTWNQA